MFYFFIERVLSMRWILFLKYVFFVCFLVGAWEGIGWDGRKGDETGGKGRKGKLGEMRGCSTF